MEAETARKNHRYLEKPSLSGQESTPTGWEQYFIDGGADQNQSIPDSVSGEGEE